MARANGSARKLQSNYRALQQDLNAVIEDLQAIANGGADIGIEKARDQLQGVQEQIHGLLRETAATTERSADELRRTVADRPMTSIAAAFALGVAAASFFGARR